MRNSIVLPQRVARSIVKSFVFFTHFCDCSVKTELICRDNYAKNSLNRFQIGCTVFRQFSISFAFELTSGQWGRRPENWTSAFSKFQQIPCGLSSLIECHFFSEPGPMGDHCPLPKLLAYRDTSMTFARHSVALSFVPQEMSLNIDINRIFPVNCSGVSCNLNSKRLTSSLSCNELNPGKYST